MIDALDIHVKGIVQGVGFRPFVYRLAKRYLINGWVMNASDGVHIHAEGESDLVDQFVLEISSNAPAAAQVKEIDITEVPIEPFDGFEIRFSDDSATEEVTLVSPDLALCADCERELFDPSDKRYRHPFITCTNCGPRFTIIDGLPYDRAATSMRDFAMCDDCTSEYANPANRRFHAQPNSCPECGPALWFAETNGMDTVTAERACSAEGKGGDRCGQSRADSDEMICQAVKTLLDGGILAIKGLGGYHLACDANNAEAVAKLRTRKQRNGKPFAVMVPTIDAARAICSVSDEEEAILAGAIRPIALLRKRTEAEAPTLAEGVADGLPDLGVMLPYTPVQHLILHDFAEALAQEQEDPSETKAGAEKTGAPATTATTPALVMTSGNIHDEPIVIDDKEAISKLGCIADAVLGNNRRILTRFDDSVVKVVKAGSAGDALQMIRRARGFAPAPIAVSDSTFAALAPSEAAKTAANQASSETIFAAGPEQKNTFTFMRTALSDGAQPAHEAFVSQHIGDMENADAFDAWLATKTRYEGLFELSANALACDMHPEYITSKWAREAAGKTSPALPLVEVQHHHAHIASVIAENAIEGAVCGIAFDGTGYGVDGCIWGGETIIANVRDFERFANFAYVPMPGGASAVKRPLQMAYGALWEFDLLEHPAAKDALSELGEAQCKNMDTMIEEGINTPVTSSVGRLFDAASALLGICTHPTYEGEPAIMLEAALWEGINESGLSKSYSSEALASAQAEDAYMIDVVKNTATPTSTAQDTSVILLDAAPAFKALLDDKEAGTPTWLIAKRFHNAFANAVIQVAQLSMALYGIKTVALSGGVFMNRYLIERTLRLLEQSGFTAAINRELPPNDGCVSFGEAVVTYAKTKIQ